METHFTVVLEKDSVNYMKDESIVPTRYAVICLTHGRVFLSREEYNLQMRAVSSHWKCPRCNATCEFDDDNYDDGI